MRRIGGVRFGRAMAVALDEILALKGHAVLDRDAAAERGDALDISIVDRLGMIEEPVQALATEYRG